MKQLLYSILFGTAILGVQSCDNDARYIDPNTGNALNLEKDESSGLMVHAETRKPVSIYVDTETKDTVWGRSGKVVNGKVRRNKEADGNYVYIYTEDDNDGDVKVKSDDGSYEVKNGNYKKEVEKDGDITIKDGNTKIKIDGKTGERKVKKDD